MKKYNILGRNIIFSKKDEIRSINGKNITYTHDDNGYLYNKHLTNNFNITDVDNLTIVQASVKVLGESFSRIPIQTFKIENGKKLPDLDNNLYDLLSYNPNNYTTSQEFFSILETHRNTKGNSFARIVRNKITGEIKSLNIIYPDDIKSYKFKNGELYYIYDDGKDVDEIHSDNILHFKNMVVGKEMIFGKNPIEIARTNLAITHKALQTSNNFYENNAFTTKYLQSEVGGFNQDVMKSAVEDFNKKNSGFNKLKGIVPLPPNTKLIDSPLNLVDAEFINTIKWNSSQVASLFRVPLHMLGLGENLKYSNVEQTQIDFISNTLSSIVRHYRQQLESKLLTTQQRKDGKTIEFNTQSLIEFDWRAKTASNTQYLDKGVLSINEVRADLGKIPIKNGDTHFYMANNLRPVEDLGKIDDIDKDE